MNSTAYTYRRVKVCEKCNHREIVYLPSQPLLELSYGGDINKWREKIVKVHKKTHDCTLAKRFV